MKIGMGDLFEKGYYMRKLKKIISSITAAAVAVGTAASAAVVPSDASGDWDGSYDISWYNSQDTEFTLTTPEELAGLARLVNSQTDSFDEKTIYLGSDVSFYEFADADAWSSGAGAPADEWYPIGATYGTPFKGTFDGNGFTISGIYMEREDGVSGFISFAGSGSVVRNLTLENSFIASVNTYSGGICGYNHGAVIENCVNRARIESYYYIAGGVCGVNAGGIVANSINEGIVIGSKSSGGIAGEACENAIVEMSRNSGDITASKYAGGVCGYSGDSIINSCYNSGYVKGGEKVGGILGCTVGNSEIGYCYNMGKIVNLNSLSGGVTGTETAECYACFYLKGVAEAAIADGGVSVFTEDMLTNGELVSLLGGAYVQGDSCPVLAWETVEKPAITTTAPAATTTTAKTTTTTSTTATALSKTTTSLSSDGSEIRIWAVNNVKVLSGVGDTVQLLIDGNTEKPVWSSLDTGIATVDRNGLVTAVGVGTVTIIASLDGVAASYVLTVGDAASVTTTATEATTTTVTTTKNTTTSATKTTTTTTVITTTSTTATMMRYDRGDCDGNSKIEIADAAAVIKYYACVAAGIEAKFSDDFAENTLSMYAGDADKDGKLTLADASMILKYYAKLAAGLNAEWE